MPVRRGAGKIEIHEGSSSSEEESDSASSTNEDGAENAVEEVQKPAEDEGVVEEKELRVVTFRNEPRKKKVLRKRPVRLTRQQESAKRKQATEADRLGMVKPDVVRDRERERRLRRIATSGVAQLFNAVAERQKKLDGEIDKQKGHLKDTSRLGRGLQIGNAPPSTGSRPKKEEVEDWLNDSMVKDEIKPETDDDGDYPMVIS